MQNGHSKSVNSTMLTRAVFGTTEEISTGIDRDLLQERGLPSFDRRLFRLRFGLGLTRSGCARGGGRWSLPEEQNEPKEPAEPNHGDDEPEFVDGGVGFLAAGADRSRSGALGAVASLFARDRFSRCLRLMRSTLCQKTLHHALENSEAFFGETLDAVADPSVAIDDHARRVVQNFVLVGKSVVDEFEQDHAHRMQTERGRGCR